jgi:hypothetical protein
MSIKEAKEMKGRDGNDYWVKCIYTPCTLSGLHLDPLYFVFN